MVLAPKISNIQIGELGYESIYQNGEYAMVQAARYPTLTAAQFRNYLSAFSAAAHSAGTGNSASAGRGSVIRDDLAGQRVIIRLYRRGGLVQYLLRHRFLCTPWNSLAHTRPVHEFCLNAVLSTVGCAVPQPVAVFVRRCAGLWWEGLIITEELEGRNLLELVREQAAPEFLRQNGFAAGRAAGAVLQAGVCHADLHLGNVICRPDGSVALIDFDKALVVRGTVGESRAMLESRWRRSAQKHNVEQLLADSFYRGLREVVP